MIINANTTFWARWRTNSPVITQPLANQTVPHQAFDVVWNAIPSANYSFSMRNLTTNQLIIDRSLAVNTTRTQIAQNHLVAGHRYRIALGASIGSTTIAGWTEREFSVQQVINRAVTFNANGGTPTSIAQRTVPNGGTLGTLPGVTRANAIFAGWWTSITSGTQIHANTPITGNMTLIARWNATLTFNSHGGSNISSRVVQIGQPIGQLPTPQWFGGNAPEPMADNIEAMPNLAQANVLLFLGWFNQQTGGTQLNQNSTINGHTTIHAMWNFTVTF
jgi:hypothetical protein